MANFGKRKQKEKEREQDKDEGVDLLFSDIHRTTRELINKHLDVYRYILMCDPFDREAIKNYTIMAERLGMWTDVERSGMVISRPQDWPEIRTMLVETHTEVLNTGIRTLRELPRPEPPDTALLEADIETMKAVIAAISEATAYTVKKADEERPTYCHICGSTEDPYSSERFPPDLTSTVYFARCRPCAEKRGLDHVNLEFLNISGFHAESNFASNFIECSSCNGLFWSTTPGIAYAWQQFDVADCPVCGHPLPKGETVEYVDCGYPIAYMTDSYFSCSLEQAQEAFNRLTADIAQNPKLAFVVERVLIGRKDVDHHALAVIGPGLNDTAAVLFRKMSGKNFSSSVRVDDRDSFLAREGWDLVEEWTAAAA